MFMPHLCQAGVDTGGEPSGANDPAKT